MRGLGMRLDEYKDLAIKDLVCFKQGKRKFMGRVFGKMNCNVGIKYGPWEDRKEIWLKYEQVKLWGPR